MTSRIMAFRWLCSVVIVLSFATAASAAMIVDAGFALLRAEPGSQFDPAGAPPPIPLIGNPLGTFDFGGTLGVHNTGDADTIIQRMEAAEAGNETIPVEFVALELKSVSPIDLAPLGGSGIDFIFISLDTTMTSGGTFTFDLAGETFDGNLTAHVVITDSAGNPLANVTENLSWTDAPFSENPPHPFLIIPGVSGGSTPLFFTEFGNEVTIERRGAFVPEPSTLSLALLGVVGLGFHTRRRRNRHVPPSLSA